MLFRSETFTPNSLDTVVHRFVFVTLYTLGMTILLFFKSTLLNTIPVFGSDGKIFISTIDPVWRPIPLTCTGFFTVF